MSEEIQIADIDKELARQWEQQRAKNQTRASLFNLIVYCHEQRRATYLQDFVRAIIEKFPCRIIFIAADLDPSHNFLRVSVSNIITSKGELSIACDQIQIDVSSSQMARVPFIILPHLLSDLPIYLLWGQDPTQENEILPYLQPYANRLIFDSECTQNLPRFSKALLNMMEQWNIEISDMNWSVISAWRDVMARTFDQQSKIQHLKNAQTVRVNYNGSKTEWISHPDIQPIYLQAWLAAQMDWKLQKAVLGEGVKTLLYGQQTRVELIPQEDRMTPPGTILSIEVLSGNEIQYLIERKEHLPQVTVHFSTANECAMPYSLPLQDSKRSSAFLRDVLYRGAGCHYRNALAKIGEMNGQIEGMTR